MTGRWFSPGSLISSTNKTDRHDVTELLLRKWPKHHQTNKQKHHITNHNMNHSSDIPETEMVDYIAASTKT